MQCAIYYVTLAANLVFAALTWGQSVPDSFELHHDDRVVWAGDGFVERAQHFGYIEAALSAWWPDRAITFRNVGWSGDTPEGISRDHYTNPPTAYEHLIDQITTPKPTALMISYGAHLGFESEPDFEAFASNMHTLFDDLGLEGIRCVLLSPLPHEENSSPRSDVAAINEKLRQASQQIETIAGQRGCAYVDLFSAFLGAYESERLTSNGIQLNAVGYRVAASVIREALVGPDPNVELRIDMALEQALSEHRVRFDRQNGHVALSVTVRRLPLDGAMKVALVGLPEGTYRLSSSSEELATMSAAEWARGRLLDIPALRTQAEELRREIRQKNALYFRHYRPQNETYLVGFRRYEQGQNANELDMLMPLIGEKENRIGRLKIPPPFTLTLERVR